MLTTTLQTIWNLLPKDENGEPERGDSTRYWHGLLAGLGKTGPDDEPVTLLRILETCGMKCALCTTDAFPGHSRSLRLYACYCARAYLCTRAYLWDIPEKTKSEEEPFILAIETAEKFARGRASADEMAEALSRSTDFLESQPYSRSYINDLGHILARREDAPLFGSIITETYDMALESLVWPSFYSDEASWAANWYLPDEAPWNLASETAEVKLREDLFQKTLRLFEDRFQEANRIREDLRQEFIRLCKLEGKYGEVDRLPPPEE